jgi:hypothetical protein
MVILVPKLRIKVGLLVLLCGPGVISSTAKNKNKNKGCGGGKKVELEK